VILHRRVPAGAHTPWSEQAPLTVVRQGTRAHTR
jgi:hypothetical protein